MSETTPTTANRTLRRLPNAAYRPREYLTEAEVERLIEAARKRGRNGQRDAAAILLAYRHGLRAAELCALQWSQVDLRHGRLHVKPGQGRNRERPSRPGSRASSPEAVAGSRPVRVRDRGRDPGHHGVVPAHGSAGRPSRRAALPRPSAHA
jgi:integrase